MEFVGVISFLDLIVSSSLKQEALMFDRIAIPGCEGWVSHNERLTNNSKLGPVDDVKWLYEQGVVFEPSVREFSLDAKAAPPERRLINNKEYMKYYKLESTHLKETFKGGKTVAQEEEEGGKHLYLSFHYYARSASVQLRELYKMAAYPVFNGKFLSAYMPAQMNELAGSDVVKVTLNALPVPDDSTPWEQVIEYRSDPDSRSKFLALRHWMSEVARAELTHVEVEEKLEYLVDQYQKHMKLHRMKTNVGTLETIITTGAEVLGDLVSFKWGKAAEALFSLKKRQVALLEGELTAPGNEVAYIVKARESFS